MEAKKPRKTDRRTLYTIGAIKDALLTLLETTAFDKITVARLCRAAEITRTTFYLHFSDLTAVLDELLRDALQVAEHSRLQNGENPSPFVRQGGSVRLVREYDALLPMCQRITDSDKYRVLFRDESLSAYIIKTIYQYEKPIILPRLMQVRNLSEREAELVFCFMLNGSFAVNKALGWNKDEN